MSDADPDISNGTCWLSGVYYTTDLYIPCGNLAFGHIHCCQPGDKCLDHNACYNDDHGTTYLAGCTDRDFDHPNCPDKKSYSDYPWAGLIYCKPNRWMACHEEGAPVTVRKGDECTCPPSTESMTVAFAAPSVLGDVGRLPKTPGGSISWYAGHAPTVTKNPTSTKSSSHSSSTSFSTSETTDSPSTITSAADTTLTIPTSTPTDIPVSQHTGLSTGAKAGIGVGSAIGAILILGALSALWMVLRRRRNDKDSETGKTTASGPNGGKPPGSELAEMPTPEAPAQPTFPELPVGLWGPRPELHGAAAPAGYNQGYGYASAAGSPPVSPASSSWHDPARVSQGWGAPMPTVPEQGGFYYGQQGRGQHGQGQYGQSQQGQEQHGQQQHGQGQYGLWASAGDRPRQGDGVVLELPA